MKRVLGLVALVVAVCVAVSSCTFNGAYDLPLPGAPVSDGNSYEVTADFADILNVVPKSPVMVDDVTVGDVTSVERVGWHARITMRIRDDIDLPDNATASIRQVSLLGEKYVDLAAPVGAPSPNRLSDGDNIPLAHTGRNPEVEEVLGALSFLLSGGGVGQLATITKELNDVMDGRTDKLRDLLSSLDGVVGTLDDQKGEIIHALQSMNDLTATLNKERGTIQGALDVAGPAIAVLDRQHTELVRMLSSLSRLGVVGTRVITASRTDLLAQLRDLHPILTRLADAGESLAPGLNLLVSFPFPKEASEIVQGDYANTSIKAQISLQNLLPNATLPGLGGTPTLPGLTKVTACLTSGSLTSPACRAVLSSALLLPQLIKDCRSPAHRRTTVCQAVGLLGSTGGSGTGSGDGNGGGGLLGGLLGGLTGGLTDGRASPRNDPRALYGGGS